MKRTATLSLLIALSVVTPNGVLAQSSDMNKKDTKGMDMNSMDMKSMDMKAMDEKGMAMSKKATTHKGVGVVEKIDATDGVVTLAHEPIKSLNWPAMTMGFKVKDKTLLDKVKPGDKVEFTLVQTGKDYVITGMR